MRAPQSKNRGRSVSTRRRLLGETSRGRRRRDLEFRVWTLEKAAEDSLGCMWDSEEILLTHISRTEAILLTCNGVSSGGKKAGCGTREGRQPSALFSLPRPEYRWCPVSSARKRCEGSRSSRSPHRSWKRSKVCHGL